MALAMVVLPQPAGPPTIKRGSGLREEVFGSWDGIVVFGKGWGKFAFKCWVSASQESGIGMKFTRDARGMQSCVTAEYRTISGTQIQETTVITKETLNLKKPFIPIPSIILFHNNP